MYKAKKTGKTGTGKNKTKFARRDKAIPKALTTVKKDVNRKVDRISIGLFNKDWQVVYNFMSKQKNYKKVYASEAKTGKSIWEYSGK